MCLPVTNPNYGLTSFDNFAWAMLALFQVMTLNGWTDIMYACMQGVNGYVFLYFISAAWISGLFLINLSLAVIVDTYSSKDAVEKAAQAAIDRAAAEAAEAERLEAERIEMEERRHKELEMEAAAEAERERNKVGRACLPEGTPHGSRSCISTPHRRI